MNKQLYGVVVTNASGVYDIEYFDTLLEATNAYDNSDRGFKQLIKILELGY